MNNPPSLPVRGAWVEMPRGRRGARPLPRRSPCGERGLKLPLVAAWRVSSSSLPVRGAWVEMRTFRLPWLSAGVAPRAGSVG